MNLEQIAQIAQLTIFPALAYIIAMERRLVRLEVLLQTFCEDLKSHINREESMLANIGRKMS